MSNIDYIDQCLSERHLNLKRKEKLQRSKFISILKQIKRRKELFPLTINEVAIFEKIYNSADSNNNPVNGTTANYLRSRINPQFVYTTFDNATHKSKFKTKDNIYEKELEMIKNYSSNDRKRLLDNLHFLWQHKATNLKTGIIVGIPKYDLYESNFGMGVHTPDFYRKNLANKYLERKGYSEGSPIPDHIREEFTRINDVSLKSGYDLLSSKFYIEIPGIKSRIAQFNIDFWSNNTETNYTLNDVKYFASLIIKDRSAIPIDEDGKVIDSSYTRDIS